MTNNYDWIIKKLPYAFPFLFVDDIQEINETNVKGSYTWDDNLPFYDGHFLNNPITPGVLLTECMAQIGLASLGIYLLQDKLTSSMQIGMTSSNSDYYIPVLPGEKVIVKSEKVFFRFNKLKCNCKMYNNEGKLVAKSEIAGMFKV